MNEVEEEISNNLLEEIENNYIKLAWYKKFWYLSFCYICYILNCISYFFLCIKDKFNKHS